MQDRKLAMQNIKMEKNDVPLTGTNKNLLQSGENETYVVTDSDSDTNQRRGDRRSRSTDRQRPPSMSDHRSNNSRKDDHRTRPASPEWGAKSSGRQPRSDDEERVRKDRSKNAENYHRQSSGNGDHGESSRKYEPSLSKSRNRSTSSSDHQSRRTKSSGRSDDHHHRTRLMSPTSDAKDKSKSSHVKSFKPKSSHKKKSKSRRRSRSPPTRRNNSSSSNSDDDHRYKKKTKKSKRGRSRSRQR